MKTCYFTATGNCLYVARRIGGELLSIPQLMRSGSMDISDDAVGVVCPVYACEMPMMVREFMAKASIRAEYFFFVYTYGMGYGEAFAHAELAARERGLTINYINAIQMVDNYLPVFEMQDQIRTLPAKDVEGHADMVCRDIRERKRAPVVFSDRTREQMAMYSQRLAVPILRKDAAQRYVVNDNCTRCGICAKVCPANNISVADKVVFSSRCEVCYACLHNCPQNALHLATERSAARFRNGSVTLRDIIQANA